MESSGRDPASTVTMMDELIDWPLLGMDTTS